MTVYALGRLCLSTGGNLVTAASAVPTLSAGPWAPAWARSIGHRKPVDRCLTVDAMKASSSFPKKFSKVLDEAREETEIQQLYRELDDVRAQLVIGDLYNSRTKLPLAIVSL